MDLRWFIFWIWISIGLISWKISSSMSNVCTNPYMQCHVSLVTRCKISGLSICKNLPFVIQCIERIMLQHIFVWILWSLKESMTKKSFQTKKKDNMCKMQTCLEFDNCNHLLNSLLLYLWAKRENELCRIVDYKVRLYDLDQIHNWH